MSRSSKKRAREEFTESSKSTKPRAAAIDDDGEDLAEEFDDEFDPSSFIDEERSKLCALIKVFPEEELRRFEAARRCAIKASDVKTVAHKTIEKLTGDAEPKVDDKMLIAIGGLTKMYLSELTELARTIAHDCGDTGALQPRHLREAYRKLKHKGRLPGSKVVL